MHGGYGTGGPEAPQPPQQWAAPQPAGWQPTFRQWQRFVPLGSRAMLALAGLSAAAAIQLLWIATWISYRATVNRFPFEEPSVVVAQVQDAQRRLALVEPLALIAAIVAGTFFIVWFHRAYKNLGTLGARNVSHKPGWAIGSWFIPFVNLVLPKQLANEVWRASDPDGPSGEFTTWTSRAIPPLYNWWWGLWILANVVEALGLELQRGADGPHRWLQANELTIAGHVAEIVAAVLAGLVVMATTRRQDARAERVRSESQPEFVATVWAGS